jgi:hypothetical protein
MVLLAGMGISENLRIRDYAHSFVGRNELHAVALLDALVQRIAVVGAVTNLPLWSFPEETLLEGRFNEFCFMRRS